MISRSRLSRKVYASSRHLVGSEKSKERDRLKIMQIDFRKALWFLIALLQLSANEAHCQWSKVASGIAAGLSEQGGLSYNEGILWLATPSSIYKSMDSGLTWKPVGTAEGTVSDLVFCDSTH